MNEAPAYITVCPSSNSTLHASRPASGRACAARVERFGDPGLHLGVVVQKQDPVCAAFERPADAGVVAAGEAEVRAVPKELDLREAALDLGVGAVGRAVVDADRLDRLERGERTQRVLAAVPVEHDGDELHCSVLT